MAKGKEGRFASSVLNFIRNISLTKLPRVFYRCFCITSEEHIITEPGELLKLKKTARADLNDWKKKTLSLLTFLAQPPFYKSWQGLRLYRYTCKVLKILNFEHPCILTYNMLWSNWVLFITLFSLSVYNIDSNWVWYGVLCLECDVFVPVVFVVVISAGKNCDCDANVRCNVARSSLFWVDSKTDSYGFGNSTRRSE